MVWQQARNTQKYAVVIYNYESSQKFEISLTVGETVNIQEETAGWYRGFCTKNKSNRGIFPKNYVQLKDCIIDRSGQYETLHPRESPIVTEITSVLKEWGHIWKCQYVNNDVEFEMLKVFMLELIDIRKLILSSKITMDELRELQQAVTSKIDYGNALLGLDLVVRDEVGNILCPETTGTMKLFRQHELAVQRIAKESSKKYPRSTYRPKFAFNLLLNLKSIVYRMSDDTDILMSLFDVKEGKFFTESYIIKYSKHGIPKHADMSNLRVLFTDLGTRDLQREKISLVCQIIRVGCMEYREGTDSKKLTKDLRRPFGVAALDLTDVLKGSGDNDEEKDHFVPFQQCSEKDFMENVIKKMVNAKEKDINHKGQGLWMTFKILPGDKKQVMEDNPHLVLGSLAIARKMGFPEVIYPDDVRNDIYVTLLSGEFNRGSKTADKNVQVTMSACNDKGQVILNAISTGAGGEMVTEYKSVIYYHEDRPKWFEHIKVHIPLEVFPDAHLKFTFHHRSSTEAKDRSDKAFLVSYIKLMNDDGTTVADKEHELNVYKVDSKREAVSYLSLPPTRVELEKRLNPQIPSHKQNISAGGYTLSHRDNVLISTQVCSTKLTHNVNLMGLLRWRENSPEQLQQHLLTLTQMKIDGEEVVKFLHDVLDAIFNILVQTKEELYDNIVFEALIFIIGLISDRKYHQFRSVLDVYIEQAFSSTLAYNKLMAVLKDYIDRAPDTTPGQTANDSSLLRAMKSLEYIFKFIIKSRKLFSTLNEGRGKQQFEVSVKHVFTSISGMMQYDTSNTLLVQGAALKYLPSTFSDVMTVFNSQEFSLLIVDFITYLSKDRLVRQKLTCLNDIVHSKLFMKPECRAILLPMILDQVKPLIERSEELEECARIVGDIMEHLNCDDVGPVAVDISTIVTTLLRTIIQTVITMDRKSSLIGHFVALMVTILRQMSESNYTQYLRMFSTTIDLTDFLMEILLVIRDLINKSVFPKDWNEMIMLLNSVFLKSLRYFSHTIRDQFKDPFNDQLWNNFFHCAIAFLTQDPLQLETFSSTKRHKIINRYKDMRRETGFEIRSMWFNLGNNKIHFIPAMVGPILEMTLIPEIELRKATIPIFFDMMQCEFNQINPVSRKRHIKANFDQVETEIITQLDALVEGGRGDAYYRDLFYSILLKLFEQHTQMRDHGLKFVEQIHALLQRLLEYRTIINDENKENQMSCTVNLLNFYHEIDRQEMYIRYLHKLCDLHLDCDNYTEAAYTLMLYAKLLNWRDEPLPSLLLSDKYPLALTHRELKEVLYIEITDYFDKGKMWEKGLELCKELAYQYENETYDYIGLSDLLKQQAEFYTRIMKQMRPEPEYFRVGYFGQGFPSFLQNKYFIYRGKEYERLSDFTSGLQNQFPLAQLLKTLATPSSDLASSDGQFLQINAVSPIPKRQFTGKVVKEQIKKYYKVNEVQKFTFSRRTDDGGDNLSKMWLDRTFLVTSYPLPGILRWFPVVSTDVVSIAPLANAIETMESANKKLQNLVEDHRSDPNIGVGNLGMILNGVVNPAVNGGLSNYKVFYSEDYLKTNPSDGDLIAKLKVITQDQVELADRALQIHDQKAPDSLRPFHQSIVDSFKQLLEKMEKELGLQVKHLGSSLSNQSPKRRPQTHQPIRSQLSATNVIDSPTNHTDMQYDNRHSTLFKRRSFSPAALLTKSSSPSRNTTYGAPNNKKKSIPSDLTDGSPKYSSGVIELNQEIKAARPRRPDKSSRPGSRPPSGQFASNGNMKTLTIVDIPDINADISGKNHLSRMASNSSADSLDVDDDAPPPIPEKTVVNDYSNLDDDTTSTTDKKKKFLSMRSLSHKDKPVPPLPDSNSTDVPPTPPKRSQSTLRT